MDASSSDESSSSDSDDADDSKILIARKKLYEKGRNPRKSVSAEAYGEWNRKARFTPTIIEKPDEMRDEIRTKLKKSFMFSNLDSGDLETVISAMRVVTVSEGDMVIQQDEDGDEMYVVAEGSYS